MRTNIYTEDEQDGTRTLDGWFDPETVEEFAEGTRWDGNNHVSVHVGQYEHQVLYRTPGGRWVLHTWSQVSGAKPDHKFIDGGAARQWLLIAGQDEAVERFFGSIAEESGPGRPAVGDPVNIRLGAAQAAVDEYAQGRGITRAAAVRELVEAGLRADEEA